MLHSVHPFTFIVTTASVVRTSCQLDLHAKAVRSVVFPATFVPSQRTRTCGSIDRPGSEDAKAVHQAPLKLPLQHDMVRQQRRSHRISLAVQLAGTGAVVGHGAMTTFHKLMLLDYLVTHSICVGVDTKPISCVLSPLTFVTCSIRPRVNSDPKSGTRFLHQCVCTNRLSQVQAQTAVAHPSLKPCWY